MQSEEEVYGAQNSNSTHRADNVKSSLDQTCAETLRGSTSAVVVCAQVGTGGIEHAASLPACSSVCEQAPS